MALYLIVVQAHFVMNNIFEGLIWFFLPVALVITNDIWAYICGMAFGRTPLIKLSPKKTVEGFVGAWVFTIFFGLIFVSILSRYSYFICPVNVNLPLIQSFHHTNNHTGPRRQHLHRSKLHPQPRLHPSRLRHLRQHSRSPMAPPTPHTHRCSHSVPPPCSRDLCISDRAFRRLLRLRSKAHVQRQGFRR